MQKQGWIKIYRKIIENPLMAKPNYLAVWIYLLVNANFEDKEIVWNNKKTVIKRGQFVGSLRQIADHYKIGIATVSYILKYFISEHMIEQSSNRRFTLFTILNYDMYQEDVEQQTEIKLKSNRKQSETTKNEKNIKNEKNNNIYIKKTFKKNNLSLEVLDNLRLYWNYYNKYSTNANNVPFNPDLINPKSLELICSKSKNEVMQLIKDRLGEDDTMQVIEFINAKLPESIYQTSDEYQFQLTKKRAEQQQKQNQELENFKSKFGKLLDNSTLNGDKQNETK